MTESDLLLQQVKAYANAHPYLFTFIVAGIVGIVGMLLRSLLGTSSILDEIQKQTKLLEDIKKAVTPHKAD